MKSINTTACSTKAWSIVNEQILRTHVCDMYPPLEINSQKGTKFNTTFRNK